MAIEVGHGPGGLFSDGSALNAKATGSTTLRTLAARFADVANVKDYGASGSAQTTTGSISSGSNQLTVASAIDFAVGQGISVAEAGPASALLVTSITAINGLVFTLATTAGTNASNKAVKHDDTVAIQAAITASGTAGTVVLGAGTHNITSGLVLGASTAFLGIGTSVSSVGTIIDATELTVGNAIAAPTNSIGIVIADVSLVGPAIQSTASLGINLQSGTSWAKIERVGITGFQYGFYLSGVNAAELVQCQTNSPTIGGLYISGSSFISVLGGTYMNTIGWGNHNGNIIIVNSSYDVLLALPMIDEGFNQGGGRVTASLYLMDCSNVSIQVPKIYYSHGGYGIRLGTGVNNPTNTQIMVNRIERFSASTAPTAGIEIRGSGTKIYGTVVDVSGDAGTTAISDLASDTRMYGVTEVTNGPTTTYIALKDPNLPTASPGAGSKQLWYDAADGNRVKFAP